MEFGELFIELVLLIDGNCGEDMNDLEFEFEDVFKGVMTRVCKLKERLIRRGKRKLLFYRFVKMSVDVVCDGLWIWLFLF